MSGWNKADQMMEEDMPFDFPAVNNITIAGYLPHDQVPSPVKSRSFMEAHFKSVRLFRRYCRYMPFVVNFAGFRKYSSPEQAKLQLARYWRQHNKVRDPWQIDCFVARGYDRLYNVQNGDIWGGHLLD